MKAIAQTGLKELKSENINPHQIRAVEHTAQTGLKELKSENTNPHQIGAAGPKASGRTMSTWNGCNV